MVEFFRFMVEFFHDPRRNLGLLMLFVACYAICSFLPVIQKGLMTNSIEQFLMLFSIASSTVVAAWLLLAKSTPPKTRVKSEPPA